MQHLNNLRGAGHAVLERVGRGAKWTIPRDIVEGEPSYVSRHFYDTMRKELQPDIEREETRLIQPIVVQAQVALNNLEVGDKH